MSEAILKIFSVAIGGALGSVARYLVNIAFVRDLSDAAKSPLGNFPFATFTVNILGSFLIGLIFVLINNRIPGNENLKLFILVGFLGAFTTFRPSNWKYGSC